MVARRVSTDIRRRVTPLRYVEGRLLRYGASARNRGCTRHASDIRRHNRRHSCRKKPQRGERGSGAGPVWRSEGERCRDGVFVAHENKRLIDESHFIPSLEVKPGMILTTRCNALLSGVGRTCFVEATRPGLMLSDKTLQLVPNASRIHPEFLLYALRRNPYRSYVERAANGTDAKNITQDQLRAAPIWVPALSKQQEVADTIRNISRVVETTANHQRALFQLRSEVVNAIVP
jgi:Type I restriction modification DNA specificity domain